MKELLKELGFEHLPMLSEFWVKWEDRQLNDFNCIVRMNEYVELITQPITKGMFIPCGKDGNVLSQEWIDAQEDYENKRCAEVSYQQALYRVLFKSDTSVNIIFMNNYETIEQAINAGVKLTPKQ